ncbi:hypothetical protein [Xanthomonas sp. BRIP62409]|uniref:hypothetical protein n=1 Tax=Xanthomonas sp. BRIP62409 TaxID=2182388 RepID=UPI0013E03CE9|nr:hypothetical protein [Xanthomonas sp. BRIP62409]
MQPLKNWIEAELGAPLNSTSNALAATFQMALLELLRKNITADHDEETITAAILGAFTAAAPFCCLAYQPALDPSYLWVRYAKSGSGLMTEPGRGADFALVICMPDGTFRVSVFQAKMEKGTGSFSIEHISPARATPPKLPEPQFLRLADYGLDILNDLAHPKIAPVFSNLHWLHYLVYESDKIRCSAITNHQNVHTILSAKNILIVNACVKLWGKNIKNFPKGWKETVKGLWSPQLLPNQSIIGNVLFEQLLTEGADELAAPSTGWLILNNITEARQVASILAEHMPVYSAQTRPGPEPTPFDPGSSPLRTKRAVRTANVVSPDGSAHRPRQTDQSNEGPGLGSEKSQSPRRGPGNKG